jgi:Flp pilus assembly pilin Flp
MRRHPSAGRSLARKRRLERQRGQSTAEYLILAALIAGAVLGVIAGFQTALSGFLFDTLHVICGPL